MIMKKEKNIRYIGKIASTDAIGHFAYFAPKKRVNLTPQTAAHLPSTQAHQAHQNDGSKAVNVSEDSLSLQTQEFLVSFSTALLIIVIVPTSALRKVFSYKMRGNKSFSK